MEPEIARRCHDCGASVRSGSVFCPQCGKPLKGDAASASTATEVPENLARRITDPGRSAATVDSRQSAPVPVAPLAPAEESRATVVESQRREEVIDDGVSISKRQRVTAAARDVVEEKLSPRVEKLRHASNVMLEEAAYDPSLRFVLVAIILLLLSLFLLLLNYLIE